MNKMDKAMEQKNADRPVALKVEHVSKNFKLPVERAGSLKNMLFNWLRGIRGYRTQEVLKDITLISNKVSFSALSVRTALVNPLC